MKTLIIFLCLLLLQFSYVYAQSNSIGSGISLDFSSSAGHVSLGDSYNSLAFPFSFETWINPDVYPTTPWGGIMGSDNDLSAYYGFWIRIGSTGKIQIEFGDGKGAGSQFRRGYSTANSVLLDKWTHVSVVCKSVTDIHFYFNGIEQQKTSTDGTSLGESVTHSSATATLGFQANQFGNQYFDGQLDEVRLWNVARTEANIRNFMCKKLGSNASGLIGYWTTDESYTSTTVLDQTTPSENGTFVGTVTKLTSGAPLGNLSKNTYTNNWTGVNVKLESQTNDIFYAYKIIGNPLGIHVYLVNSQPYSTSGLAVTPNYYFGVFCAETSTPAHYSARYQYSESNGVITPLNEEFADLAFIPNGSDPTWADLNSTLDVATNKIAEGNELSRGEYILNIESDEKLMGVSDIDNDFSLYPNPAINTVKINWSEIGEDVTSIRIVGVAGNVVKEINDTEQSFETTVNVADLQKGIYLVQMISNAGVHAQILIVIK